MNEQLMPIDQRIALSKETYFETVTALSKEGT